MKRRQDGQDSIRMREKMKIFLAVSDFFITFVSTKQERQ